MSKDDPVHNYSLRFKEVRRLLGITQEELGNRLFVSQNYIAQIESGRKKAPSPQLLNAIETLRASIDSGARQSIDPSQQRKSDRLKLGGLGAAPAVKNRLSNDAVASRLPLEPRSPSTRVDVQAYMQQLIESAEQSGNPNAWPVIHDRLKKRFPLDEWDEKPE